ncbi:MAG: hypothetical protein FP816_04120 [Desulfobacteraceae bacterium]|nr:hypothetical protein [Desulfobacteraceae bacterium]MBU4053036.1 hypothetical protein [Pseudomonadota bacterium]
MEDFIQTKNGKDTGDEFTWREALKTPALADHRLNSFPGYLAHCNMAGGDMVCPCSRIHLCHGCLFAGVLIVCHFAEASPWSLVT